MCDNFSSHCLVCGFQGHVYSLIGALGDDRFALMHAGYKHTLGADGFPKDLDLAYAYYSNVGAQSSIDHSQAHEMEVSVNILLSLLVLLLWTPFMEICHTAIEAHVYSSGRKPLVYIPAENTIIKSISRSRRWAPHANTSRRASQTHPLCPFQRAAFTYCFCEDLTDWMQL